MPKISREIKEQKKEAFLKSLEMGVSITDACVAANVSRNTIWEWRKRSKRFNNKVNSIIDSRTQSMEDALYANGLKGNVIAQIFWLKNRSQDRWKDKFEGEVEIKGELKITDAKKRLIDELDILAAKKRKRKNNK